MMIVTTRISKKTILAVGALTAALLLSLCLFAHVHANPATPDLPQLATNQERVEYLESLGWKLRPEPLETFQFLLPDPLEEPYLSFSELQDAQGYDFAACSGKQVIRCTYQVLNDPRRAEGVQLNLYLCEGYPVGGDVCCPGEDGFRASLVFPDETHT